MCGIVAVVSRDSDRDPPVLADIVAALEDAQSRLPFVGSPDLAADLATCAGRVEGAEALLRGVPGVLCLARDSTAGAILTGQLDDLTAGTEALEAALDAGTVTAVDVELEQINATLIRLKDALWSVRNDRVATAAAALDLAGGAPQDSALAAFAQIEIALAAIDRLEVRGRDSAGLAVLVRGHVLDLDAPSVRELWDRRATDPLLRSMSVRAYGTHVCFVYKAAAEIGELGDNTRVLREAVRSDPLLHLALGSADARALVLGHTRWASVGMISEANAHPMGSDDGPFVAAVLNGDVDNHADLRVAEDLVTPVEITTDAKIIPVLTSRRMAEGADLAEAFRRTVSAFEGSVAIAALSLADPDKVLLAVRGSGQALYVGVAEDAFVVASELYGLVEQASGYLRMDGETPADPSNPASRGQVIVLDTAHAGSVQGIHRIAYNGTPLPVHLDEVLRTEITTRDIDRSDHPHFLIKEINEAPRSFRKTLRGKVVDTPDGPRVVLGPDTLPDEIRSALRNAAIRHVIVTGQGTAAVAGQAVAAAIRSALDPLPITVDAIAAPELSGFGLRDDMSDTLLVAISQSGTTTDTNRTVEIARGRGARVVAVVNRRQSDLVDRADGVLYTSDGRDLEMAVPSTKAFYAQVAAGFLLAAAISAEVDGATGVSSSVLESLVALPDAMERVLEQREHIADIARAYAPMRRYWAVVGNGANRVAAEEVRIKLSELCYKSVASDVTEEKKHIDLSAEPLIFVCAAGLSGSNAEDVGKEIAYFRAHKAAPIVVAGVGEGRYEAALDVIRVPSVHPAVAFVLSAMAGHLFGYEAALAIDAQARPLREARSAIEAMSVEVGGEPDRLLGRVRTALAPIASVFMDGLRTGAYDGHLEASKAVRIASILRYATGISPLDSYQIEQGKIGTPHQVLEDLTEALTAGIDELTRPVDAIRHQAKTVTVGITRAEETLLHVPLVREVLAAGVARDRLNYGTLRTLSALDSAVERVTGYTHYAIEGDPDEEALVRITDRGGIARDLQSRTDRDPRLRGTKHRVAVEREVLVTRGHDGRTCVIVPEVKGPDVTGIALMHVRFRDRLEPDVMRAVLLGYRKRYSALRDTVTETEPAFRDDLLGEIAVEDLLIDSIQALAEKWRAK